MGSRNLKKYLSSIILVISCMIFFNWIQKNFIVKQEIEIESTLVNKEESLEKNEKYYTIKEVIENICLVDVNRDGEKDIVCLRRKEDIDYDKNIFYSYAWKSTIEGVELEDVFLDVIDGKTGEVYSTPFERKEEGLNYYVDEIKVIYPKENKPVFYISTACIGEGIGVQKRFRLLQCEWDKVKFIWSMGYETKTGIEVMIHYLNNYMAEIIIDQEVIVQIDLEKVLDKSYFEYIKNMQYNPDGLVIKQEYESIIDVENRYSFIEVSEKTITAKAVLQSGAYYIGMLVVEYYFENGELLCQYSFEEIEKGEQ